MATQPVQSAFGTDPESTAANEKWKQAYDQLLESLNARQEKPFFDPVWLAAAQGFLTPKKTGNFFEGLGTVAGNVAKAQEAEQNRALETAKARLDLAGMGVQQANQQATARELARRAGIGGEPSGEPASTPSGGFSGAPSGGLAGAPSGILSGAPSGVLSGNLSGNLSGQPAPSAPSPFGDMEPIGQYPVNPNLIKTPQEFYKRAMQGGERDLAAIEKGWTSYQKDFLSPRFEGGNVYDPITGYMYSKNTGGTATTTFMTGQGGSFAIPEASVREHQRLIAAAQKNPNNPEVWERLEAFEDFWRKPRTSSVKPPAIVNIPVPTETVQPVAQAPAPGRPAAQPSAQALAARPGATAAIPPPPEFSAPLRFTPVTRPLGRLSAEQKAAFDAEDKTRLDAALAEQKSSLDAQKAQYEAQIAENKAQRDLSRDINKAGQIAGQEISNIAPREYAKQAAEQEVKARQEISDNSKEANDTIAYANQFRKYAELPNAKQMFGILNNQDLSSGLAKLVTETIRVGTTSIGMPAIEDVMRNANMNTKEQAQYRSFLQLATQLQLQRAKYMKGSVSNYEQGILGNAGITAQDTPETIRMKADIMAARAQFDRQVARKFKESKQDAAAFLSSDEYINKMIPDYHDRLNRLIGGETRLQSKPPVQPKTPAQSSTVSRADALAGIK